MEQTKITVKIYGPLLTAFDKQLSRMFIKRDSSQSSISVIPLRRSS